MLARIMKAAGSCCNQINDHTCLRRRRRWPPEMQASWKPSEERKHSKRGKIDENLASLSKLI